MYRFDPGTLALTTIGTLDCPRSGGPSSAFSMAVDRKGVAWVLFSNRKLYQVNIETAACTATDYQTYQHQLSVFGMGFVSRGEGSQEETLYLADYFGRGIASLDTQSLTVAPIVSYGNELGSAELTGTGDGRLFGFFRGTPDYIAEVNPGTGQFLSKTIPPEIQIGAGWAFAHWGGDFYLFTNPGADGTKVDRYSLNSGTKTTVMMGIPDNIVGAGVSTCAPLKHPQ
ncbi:hypothetical protein [Chondromyces crocatus]|uniref:hypothetical protein n=1 Tax=Chondromyces crocatus TaxID=52 RepID=UPI0012E2BA2F|nr:hypothetical protein [Chondromyces crocatus]